MKTPRKVALINVRDYPRGQYKAYWQITIQEPDNPADYDVAWRVRLMAYEPIGYAFQGKNYSLEASAKEWPTGVPRPSYPGDAHLKRDVEYKKLSPAEQAKERAAQEAYRTVCTAIHSSCPQPLHLIEEVVDVIDSSDPAFAGKTGDDLRRAVRDAADTAAQKWALEKMKGQKRPKAGTVASFAGALPLDVMGGILGGIYEDLRSLWRRFAAPLLAIAYSTTVRNNRLNQVRDAIDGGAGAGLLRIYDGTRPATCGTATTLLAELTFSDPCSTGASSGTLTMSAITADASANATGTATWFRSVDSTGTCCIDGNCGTSGSDMNMNSTSVNSGVQVSCSSFVLTAGNP